MRAKGSHVPRQNTFGSHVSASVTPASASIRGIQRASVMARGLHEQCERHATAQACFAPPSRRCVLAQTLGFALLFPATVAAAPLVTSKEVDDATSAYVQELLKRTRENKDRRAKERLIEYYKRNYKDYFEFEGGNIKAGAARGLSSETQQEILNWLEKNK